MSSDPRAPAIDRQRVADVGAGTAALPARQRAEMLAAVRRLRTEHPDLRGRDQVEVPMQLVYWAYHRKGGERTGSAPGSGQ